jgi:hypothetical protein
VIADTDAPDTLDAADLLASARTWLVGERTNPSEETAGGGGGHAGQLLASGAGEGDGVAGHRSTG